MYVFGSFVECFMAVFGKYWLCVLGKVSLSVLWLVLGEYGCVFLLRFC